MIGLKNPSSSFMTSYSYKNVSVSVQKDNVVEHSGIKCSFMVYWDFQSLVFWILLLEHAPEKDIITFQLEDLA